MASFREFIKQLDEENKIKKIKKEVSTEYEAANVLAALDGEAVMFEKVKGYGTKIVGGIVSSRELVAKGLGCKKEEILHKMVEAMNNPKEPEVVNEAPCQEVIEEEVNLEKILPALLHMEKDGGKYIASAVCITKDPDYGRNMCYHRLMLIGKDKFATRIIKNRGTDTAFQKTNEDLEIAICIGNSVPVLVSAATSLPKEEDELAMANALGETKLVKCKTLDLEVPADCEIVLEGKILKNETHSEGPFLDLTETMDQKRENQPVIKIHKITHRKDFIYQTLLPGKAEHKILMGMPMEPSIYNKVSKVANCKNVLITQGGCSWLHGIVQIKKEYNDDGKKAIEAAFEGHKSMKHCIVIDEDIDIYNPNEVEWAIATRFQADKDAVIKPMQPGSSLDPSGIFEPGKKTKTCKVGLDATIPFDKKDKSFRKEYYKKVNLNDYLKE